jgi:hypothetical protein
VCSYASGNSTGIVRRVFGGSARQVLLRTAAVFVGYLVVLGTATAMVILVLLQPEPVVTDDDRLGLACQQG